MAGAPLGSDGGTVIALSDDPRFAPHMDESGALLTPDDEGGVLVDLAPPAPALDDNDDDHFANLAEKLPDDVRRRIAEEIVQGVEADDQSRQEWLEMRAEGIKMLGTLLEKPRADAGNTTEPFEGMSTVRHPLLIESIARFQATAGGELYPPSGPVKVRDDRPSRPANLPPDMGHNGGPPLDDGAGDPTEAAVEGASREELAEALEAGFNHNLTAVDRGWRADSVRMLFEVAFSGCAFKKIYDCPIRERPISRFVPASDIIVSNGVSHELDAGRLTHRIRMEKSILKRMQLLGQYRDVSLATPAPEPDAVESAKAAAQGLADRPQRQEDQPYILYETYADIDVPGYEHKNKRGVPTGLPLPYKAVVDRDSHELLQLQRNWEPDDDTHQARQVLVKYGFIPALGFYDLGMLHLVGNGDKALTAAWREALDCAMFGNFPGFIYNEAFIRNWTNQNRVPPGGGIGVKGVGNLPLDQAIKPLPYKDVSTGMVALIQHVEQRMDRVAGTAELPIGEGRQDAPVGTTLALIEQATKIMAAVFIGLYDSLAQELDLLKERYRQNPEAFWRWKKKKGFDWEKGLFLRALEDNEIVPAADPNTHSHMMRIMRAWAILQLAQVAPTLFNPKLAARRFFQMIGVSNPDEFLATDDQMAAQAGAPPPDPARMAQVEQKMQATQTAAQMKLAEIQAKADADARSHASELTEQANQQQADERDRQLQAQAAIAESADRAADRASRERVAMIREATERAKLSHDANQQEAQRQHDAGEGQADRNHEAAQQVATPLTNPPG